MSCEDREIPNKAEAVSVPVNISRAFRQYEQFLRSINPYFQLGVSDRGDDHLTEEELVERRVQEGLEVESPEPSGRLIANCIYNHDSQQVNIVRTDSKKSSENNF